jgi:hypothetical protein
MIHVGLPLLSVRFAGLGSNWWQGLTPRAKQAGQPADAGSVRCVDVHHELRRPIKHAVGPAIRSCAPRDCAGDLSPPPPLAQSSDRCAIGPQNHVRGFSHDGTSHKSSDHSRLPTGPDQKHGGQPSRLLPSMRHPPDSRPQCQRPQVASAQIAAKSINRPTNATSACSGPDGSRPENSRERPDQVTMLVAPTGKQSRNEKTLLMQ